MTLPDLTCLPLNQLTVGSHHHGCRHAGDYPDGDRARNGAGSRDHPIRGSLHLRRGVGRLPLRGPNAGLRGHSSVRERSSGSVALLFAEQAKQSLIVLGDEHSQCEAEGVQKYGEPPSLLTGVELFKPLAR